MANVDQPSGELAEGNDGNDYDRSDVESVLAPSDVSYFTDEDNDELVAMCYGDDCRLGEFNHLTHSEFKKSIKIRHSMDCLKVCLTFLLQMLVGTRAVCLLKACIVLEALTQEVCPWTI